MFINNTFQQYALSCHRKCKTHLSPLEFLAAEFGVRGDFTVDPVTDLLTKALDSTAFIPKGSNIVREGLICLFLLYD